VTDDADEPESSYDDVLRAIARASERVPPPPESSIVTGSVVAGKLRVVRLLGVGGMGAVYEVEHEMTKHRRALKVLRRGASAEGIERFLREASAAGRIGSAHIAQTFDAGTLEDGSPFLLMELLAGETLEQRLRRAGPVPPGELADWIDQVCEGVHAAHEAGIVHRDLKPDNLFLEVHDEGIFVKVLDFGISKFDERVTGAPGLTQQGSVMGTPQYMAPEQLRSAGIDRRTDVYALGVILYECACGERPFDAASAQHLAVLIARGQPIPLAQRSPSLPPGFCQVVHRAMAVEPERRFGSARALAEALAPFRGLAIVLAAPTERGPREGERGSGPSSPTVRVIGEPPTERGARSGALRVALLGLVVLGAAGALAAGAWHARRASPPAGASAATVRGDHPLGDPARGPVAEIAPPAARLAPLPEAPEVTDAAERPQAPAEPPPLRAPQSQGRSSSPSPSRSRAQDRGLAGENPFR
jgi:serine/threonine-protein kinase